MSLLCILAAVAAFALFGLSTDNHHNRRFARRLTMRRSRDMRRLAWLLVALCLALAFAAKGPVYGAVFWLGALSFGAAFVFLVLNLAPVRGAK